MTTNPIIATVLTAACIAACTDESDPYCPQTGEFGNYGCAEVTGLLIDRDDQPLGGTNYSVVNRELPFDSRFNTNVMPVTPGSDGSFRLRITRYLLVEPPTTPDTGSVWIIGAQRPPITSSEPGIRDSVLVTLQFAPVGAIPEPVQAVIRLPLP
jgi:hypothetical protein